MTCDKRFQRSVQAFADEVYGGDWEQITVAEFRGIVRVAELRPPVPARVADDNRFTDGAGFAASPVRSDDAIEASPRADLIASQAAEIGRLRALTLNYARCEPTCESWYGTDRRCSCGYQLAFADWAADKPVVELDADRNCVGLPTGNEIAVEVVRATVRDALYANAQRLRELGHRHVNLDANAVHLIAEVTVDATLAALSHSNDPEGE